MNELYVFSSLRQIRDFTLKFTNKIAPKSISIGNFFKNAVYVDGLNEASDSELLLCMSRACNECELASSKLHIPREFFAFLKNNDYLFSFFKEISHQKKSYDDLKFSDIYASYDEHIEILREVYQNYTKILKSLGIYDDIILPEIYELNESYLRSFECIIFQIDGLLSEFEWEILQKCAKITHLKIIFKTSKLNYKLIKKISEISSIDESKFEIYSTYELDFSGFNLTCLSKNLKNNLVLTRSFSIQTLQAAYVFEKISTFIREGISAKNIVVILPDESFAKVLRLHDKNKMLSYAMGTSVKDTLFFVALSEILTILKERKNIVLDKEYLDKSNKNLSFSSSFLNYIGVTSGIFELFLTNFNQNVSFDEFKNIIIALFEICTQNTLLQILEEELFFLKDLFKKSNLNFGALCEFLLIRLADRNIDDVGGGAVRVMGVLESRGLSFDGVIIVDFNDDLVPKRVVNEMFLSSKVRQKAGLISYYERENLQRFYYESLINSAKKVAISYVLNENKIQSRFLNEFECVLDNSFKDEAYTNLLAGRGVKNAIKFKDEALFQKHDFFNNELSFSRLNTFLRCPRMYFYKYIKHIGEPRNLDSVGVSTYGNSIHEALFEFYLEHDRFVLDKFLGILKTKNLDALELEIARQKFSLFDKSEREHFKSGWKIKSVEQSFCVSFNGVKLHGKIDRIDENLDKRLCVIDYKSGKLPKDGLQLTFYKALLGSECECYFYDLKDEMKLVKMECDLKELSMILDNLKELFLKEVNFERHIGQECQNCFYYTICRGELR